MSGPLLLASTIAFRGATLIDGTGAPPVTDALLLIVDGRIAFVGRATAQALEALPEGTRILTADGKWIIPGLIDAHVHAESESDLRTMLRWGVTSARLMAEGVAAAESLAKASGARQDIPEVFPAAPIFTTKGGWWDDGQPADPNLNRFPSTPAEAREAVGRAKALGSSEIKVMLDDMVWCRGPQPALAKLPPAVVEALIDEARSRGMRAIVHAPNLADAKVAIAAGATALAHGVLDPIDGETIAVMKARPVFYIPTMDIFEFLADTRGFVDGVLGPDPGGRPPGHDPLAPRSPAEWLAPVTTQSLRSGAYSDGYRERYPNFESLKRRLPALRENLRRLQAAGVPIALGTDMWAFPGLAVSVEAGLYAAAGFSPLEAIRAATQTAARSLGADGDRGTLERGKRADFLVLRQNPLERPENLREIDGIWKAGVRVGPDGEQRGP